MNTKRIWHACFADEASSSAYVIGGIDDQRNALSSTEKWTFRQNSWQPSANLPEAISSSSAVSSHSQQFVGYMAGGWTGRYSKRYHSRISSKDILGLKRSDMTWIKLNKTMQIGREGYSLLNIPSNQVLGC